MGRCAAAAERAAVLPPSIAQQPPPPQCVSSDQPAHAPIGTHRSTHHTHTRPLASASTALTALRIRLQLPIRMRAPLVTLLCALAALLLLCWSAAPTADAAPVCTDPSPLLHGSVIHVAVLVWVDAPEGLYRGNLTDSRATDRPFGNSIVQPHAMGVEMYVKRMKERGALPLPDGQSVTLNFVSRMAQRTRRKRSGQRRSDARAQAEQSSRSGMHSDHRIYHPASLCRSTSTWPTL